MKNRSILFWIALILVSFVAFNVLALLFFKSKGVDRAQTQYKVSVQVPDLPVTAQTIDAGEHLARTWGCAACHGDDFGGEELIPSNPVMHIFSPNITPGKGGVVANYTDADWIRAIRYGIRPDGTGLAIMNSSDWTMMSEGDVHALIAFMKQVPAVDREIPQSQIKTLGLAVAGAGKASFWDVENVDFEAKPMVRPSEESIEDFGAYIANSCKSCHRSDFKGGPSTTDPNGPHAADLSKTGPTAGWDYDTFNTAIRSGKLPDGRVMRTEHMPWNAFSHYGENESEALYRFFQTLD